MKAIGSRSSTTSSFSARVSRLPGLRPVVCSICRARSSILRLTTDAGSSFFSICSFSSQWPPIDSTSGAVRLPARLDPADRKRLAGAARHEALLRKTFVEGDQIGLPAGADPVDRSCSSASGKERGCQAARRRVAAAEVQSIGRSRRGSPALARHNVPMTPDDVLRFWFDESKPAQWWTKDADFDRTIEARFGELHRRAAACELYGWRNDARGRLAEVIVLDQFSRNIFRGAAASFANDALALALAQCGGRSGR